MEAPSGQPGFLAALLPPLLRNPVEIGARSPQRGIR
jgi:hypothetical protein